MNETINRPIPIIMAGGEGRRLRPLTDTLPKPLVPIAAEPAMTHVLRLLARHGYTEAIVSLCYRAEQIRQYYGEQAEGIRLRYAVEQTPLGTAGGVRAALMSVGDFSQREVLVISADALCNFDLSAALARHRAGGAEATLLLSHTADVSSLGVVLCAPDGSIRAFAEKPSAFSAAPDTVNTGMYLLTPRFIARIPQDRPSDFGKDIFPAALRDGILLRGEEMRGYWCDIGTLDAYFACNFQLARGEIEGIQPREGVLQHGCIISDGCRLDPTAQLQQSILLDSVTVGAHAHVEGAMIAQGAWIGARAFVTPGCVLGSGVTVAPGICLQRGLHLPAGTTCAAQTMSAPAATQEETDAVFDGFRVVQDRFSHSEIELFAQEKPDTVFCARFGAALAFAAAGLPGPVGFSSDGHAVSAATVSLAAAACAAAGGKTVDFGVLSRPESSFAALHYGCALTLFIRFDGRRCTAVLLDENGLYPVRATERLLEQGLSQGGSVAEPCTVLPSTDVRYLLRRALLPFFSATTQTYPFCFAGVAAKAILGPYFAAYGKLPHREAVLQLCLNEWGELIAFENGKEFDTWAIAGTLLRYCAGTWQLTRVGLPAAAPAFFESLGEEAGFTVERFTHCPGPDDPSIAARKLYASVLPISNPIFGAATLVTLLSQTGTSLSALCAAQPQHVRRRMTVLMPVAEKAALMRALGKLHTPSHPDEVWHIPDVLRIRRDSGWVLLRPERRAALRLIADAASAEAARELLVDAKEMLEHLRAETQSDS